MSIQTLDHLVLTVAGIDATSEFYERLGSSVPWSAPARADPIRSLYVRNPDGNLVELSEPDGAKPLARPGAQMARGRARARS